MLVDADSAFQECVTTLCDVAGAAVQQDASAGFTWLGGKMFRPLPSQGFLLCDREGLAGVWRLTNNQTGEKDWCVLNGTFKVKSEGGENFFFFSICGKKTNMLINKCYCAIKHKSQSYSSMQIQAILNRRVVCEPIVIFCRLILLRVAVGGGGWSQSQLTLGER